MEQLHEHICYGVAVIGGGFAIARAICKSSSSRVVLLKKFSDMMGWGQLGKRSKDISGALRPRHCGRGLLPPQARARAARACLRALLEAPCSAGLMLGASYQQQPLNTAMIALTCEYFADGCYHSMRALAMHAV